MNAVAEIKEMPLPPPVIRKGISESEWRTLDQLYPGARGESKLLVWDYCKARGLDPMKKPCHIVWMPIGEGGRDVVMPGIYEYRTTAVRTGEYLGHSKPVYGPDVEYMGVVAPEWCEMTVYRWNKHSQQRCEFPVVIYFREVVATRWDKDAKANRANARWTKAPRQMLTKCTEAAALREAFPDEFGGEPTAEEMEGQNQTEGMDITQVQGPRVDLLRGDTSNLDWEARDKHVGALVDLMNADKDENEIAETLRGYVSEYLNDFPELYLAVTDKLAADKIISKAKFNVYLKIGLDRK